ncbi:MAG: hypothetical protein PHO10_06725 [Gemmiger sp.]|nr:hypothetical protein [Gemmiger sp.]
MKKIASLISTMAFLLVFSLSCFAEGPQGKLVETTTQNLGKGVICTTMVYEMPTYGRSNEKSGYTVQSYSYAGRTVATVQLNARFSYDYSSATATYASGSSSTASGWSYGGQSTWCSGNTAHLTATVSGSISIPVNLSISCSPSGNIS